MTPEEFDLFFASTQRRLVGQVALVTGDVGAAQDAVQEAFVRAWQHRSRLDRDAGPEAWVRTTAMRLAVSSWRRRRREVGPAADADRVTAGPTPDRVALTAALARLPREQRVALVLHYICDLPIEQIAAETRSPVGTVKARLSRGRTALAALLGDGTREEGIDA